MKYPHDDDDEWMRCKGQLSNVAGWAGIQWNKHSLSCISILQVRTEKLPPPPSLLIIIET